MSCSSAGAILRGTGLGLEYERPRRRRILRSVRGLACLPVSLLIISFTMSRRHDAGPNPYLEGSLRVHPIILLSVCGFRIFFLPVDFRSNLPPRPRRAIRTSQPRMVDYDLISSYVIDHIPCSPCACSRRLGCPRPCRGTAALSCGKRPSGLCREEIHLPLEALPRCEPARVKMPCGCGTCARIKIFQLMDRTSKNSDDKLAKQFGLDYA